MSDRGALERLIIKAYERPDYSGQLVGEFDAYVNPNEITIAYEAENDSPQVAGTTANRVNFKEMKPGDLSLTFSLDGTGANGRPLAVQSKVEQFQTVTGYNGNIHRPNYLKVVWGTLQVKRCVLKRASIAYRRFRSDGVPMRAVITATFTDSADDQTRAVRAQDQSPDLTQIRLVRAGDTLPLLCHEIYGNPLLYSKVAGANGIDDFRNLTPGTRIFFPPLEK